MRSSSQPTSPTTSIRGFSVIELAIVVTVIGILASLAIPYYKHTQQSSQIGILKNDLRVYEQAFEAYELSHGYFPPSQPVPGQFPDGMKDRLSSTWKLPSPIGGNYRWVYTTQLDPAHRRAYIEIINSSTNPIRLTPSQLQAIDEDIDDGDPSNGRLVLFGLNIRYYIR